MTERYLSEQKVKYGDVFSEIKSMLKSQTFETNALNDIHNQELIEELLFRHSLPFLSVEADLFDGGSSKDSKIVLASCLLAHTLSLTQLDYHLDGVLPNDINQVSAKFLPIESAIAYSIRTIFRAGALLSKVSCYNLVWNECIDPVSGFVLSRMYQDWRDRFCESTLNKEPTFAIEEYLNSQTSKLLSSGYWEVMIKAAYIANTSTSEIPKDLALVARKMRIFRQLIDEYLDVSEDILSGAITLPVWLAIKEQPTLKKEILLLWEDIKYGKIDTNISIINQIKIVSSSKMKELIHKEFEDLISLCKKNSWNELEKMVVFKYRKMQ